MKQEPETYSFADLVRDGRTAWTGVRNFQARLNLRAMRKGDLVMFYHSVSEKRIVGVAKVDKEAYPDPTAEGQDWVCVDIVPCRVFPSPVELQTIKKDPLLSTMTLVRHTRLSVTPLTRAQFDRLVELGDRTAG